MKDESKESTSCNGNCENCEKATPATRRSFLGIACGVINVGLAATIVGPVVAFIGSPLAEKRKGKWVPLLGENEISVGETKEVPFTVTVKDGYMTTDRGYTTYVHRTDEGFHAFNTSCTHLGCRVQFQQDRGRYMCPCHGGVLKDDGTVVSGPPPKPLEQYPVKVEGGKVWLYKEV